MPRVARQFAIEPGTYLTSHEAANLLQMNPSTINKWVKEELISAFTTPGGHRRIKAEDLVAFLDEYKMPVPEALKFYRTASGVATHKLTDVLRTPKTMKKR